VIESFDTIANAYKGLRRLQDQNTQFQLRRLSLSPAQERKYKKLKNEIIGEVKSLRLNRARIDVLIGQLYDINKRLELCAQSGGARRSQGRSRSPAHGPG
jgi:RNA polymerase primary sigma factor